MLTAVVDGGGDRGGGEEEQARGDGGEDEDAAGLLARHGDATAGSRSAAFACGGRTAL